MREQRIKAEGGGGMDAGAVVGAVLGSLLGVCLLCVCALRAANQCAANREQV